MTSGDIIDWLLLILILFVAAASLIDRRGLSTRIRANTDQWARLHDLVMIELRERRGGITAQKIADEATTSDTIRTKGGTAVWETEHTAHLSPLERARYRVEHGLPLYEKDICTLVGIETLASTRGELGELVATHVRFRKDGLEYHWKPKNLVHITEGYWWRIVDAPFKSAQPYLISHFTNQTTQAPLNLLHDDPDMGTKVYGGLPDGSVYEKPTQRPQDGVPGPHTAGGILLTLRVGKNEPIYSHEAERMPQVIAFDSLPIAGSKGGKRLVTRMVTADRLYRWEGVLSGNWVVEKFSLQMVDTYLTQFYGALRSAVVPLSRVDLAWAAQSDTIVKPAVLMPPLDRPSTDKEYRIAQVVVGTARFTYTGIGYIRQPDTAPQPWDKMPPAVRLCVEAALGEPGPGLVSLIEGNASQKPQEPVSRPNTPSQVQDTDPRDSEAAAGDLFSGPNRQYIIDALRARGDVVDAALADRIEQTLRPLSVPEQRLPEGTTVLPHEHVWSDWWTYLAYVDDGTRWPHLPKPTEAFRFCTVTYCRAAEHRL